MSKAVIPKVSGDKKDVKSRIDFKKRVAANTLSLAVVQQHPDLLLATTEMVQEGEILEKSAVDAGNANGLARAADKVVVDVTESFDVKYGIYVTTARKYATTPAEYGALSLETRTPQGTRPLEGPLGIVMALTGRNKDTWLAKILPAAGEDDCVLETTDTPSDPASWKERKARSLHQKMLSFTPGVHWLRAAHRRKNGDTSGYTEPVSFTVK